MIPTAQSSLLSKLDLLRIMMLSREGDRREGILLRQSKGWFQVSAMGHEATGALALALRSDDFIYPYYRDRSLMLVRGMTTRQLALDYFAKRDSSSGGRQMPGHYSSAELNVVSVCTPTGGGLIPAAGTAWGMKLKGRDTVVLATVGDAATRQGEFYEAWSFAVQESLPIVFVIEDNKYGISTPTARFMPLNIGGILSEERVVKVDGRRVGPVLEAAKAAVARARKGEGPTLLWLDIDRLASHTSSDDHRVYRPLADIDAMMKRDPVLYLRDELIADGSLTLKQFEEMQQEAARQIDEDYIEAEKAADPRAEELLDHCWAEEEPPQAPPIEPGPQTMVEAVNRVFHKALESDPDVVFFGEDIEDPKGGVFGLTKGLSAKFPKQVFNSPLAEATIVGTAVGLAVYGLKPVFEIQFVDFIAPAWNQLMTNVSTLRWRTFGRQKCPLVLYTPYGAYLPGGSLWHSQSNEAALAHIPGIRVAVPSTPQDAAGLFWSAIHGDDPSIILIPKHIFRKRAAVESAPAVPFGKARVVQEGRDVTLVAWGNTLELAEEASRVLEGEASIEIIDLRSVVPHDLDLIGASLEKTGRLVAVQEDVRTCGLAPFLVGEVAGRPDLFGLLLSSPQIVARPDVAVGFNPIYEFAALPSVEDVVAAVRTAMK